MRLCDQMVSLAMFSLVSAIAPEAALAFIADVIAYTKPIIVAHLASILGTIFLLFSSCLILLYFMKIILKRICSSNCSESYSDSNYIITIEYEEKKNI